ncbi:hypothetical protein DXG01_004204, partial [Tephrocybe rancida]
MSHINDAGLLSSETAVLVIRFLQGLGAITHSTTVLAKTGCFPIAGDPRLLECGQSTGTHFLTT